MEMWSAGEYADEETPSRRVVEYEAKVTYENGNTITEEAEKIEVTSKVTEAEHPIQEVARGTQEKERVNEERRDHSVGKLEKDAKISLKAMEEKQREEKVSEELHKEQDARREVKEKEIHIDLDGEGEDDVTKEYISLLFHIAPITIANKPLVKACVHFVNVYKYQLLRWYMPVNILLTFLIGALFGWIVVKLTRTPRHLSGLVVGNCCAGNLGNLLLIIVPALCEQNGSPFGDVNVCMNYGMAYASFSMAIGAIYIWSIAYNIVRSTSFQIDEDNAEMEYEGYKRIPHKESSNVGLQSSLLQVVHTEVPSSTKEIVCKVSSNSEDFKEEIGKANFIQLVLKKLTNGLQLKEIMAPPTIAAVVGFIIGAIPQTKRLFVGQTAPLQVIQDSIALLGDGTIPSITLILGGNLTKGLHSTTVKPSIIIGIILVRYLMLPLVGICIVKSATNLGFVPADPLYKFILLIQFALPPAMNL
ncbi:hypothetical protein KI387_010095, partial [Taxus chinensis]